MQYQVPDIFKSFPELTVGFIGKGADTPNINLNDFANPATAETYAQLAAKVGFESGNVSAADEVHGSEILMVPPRIMGQAGDALITDQPGQLLTIRMADCAVIMLYDPETGAIANIHSGWRGTAADIVPKTIAQLSTQYGSKPENMSAFIGPVMSAEIYEFGRELAKENFADKYILDQHPDPEKIYLDYATRIEDQLIESGIGRDHFEHDLRSTFHSADLHSFRRDQADYAHNIAFIGLKS